MCCFSGRVRSVSGTQIFARHEGATQALVYAMHVDLDDEVAMVLPLPTRLDSSEAHIEFVDLEAFSDCFDRLDALFPISRAKSFGAPRLAPQSRSTLRVVEVGQFEASFVPSVRDFDRLDERFRIPAEAWSAAPTISDYGFAVFQLRKGASRVHPMALRFPTRMRTATFFPTLHLHDGVIHPTASFDHALYLQAAHVPSDWSAEFSAPQGLKDRLLGPIFGWNRRLPPRAWEAAEFLPSAAIARDSRGLIAADQAVYRLSLRGRLPNRDTLVAGVAA